MRLVVAFVLGLAAAAAASHAPAARTAPPAPLDLVDPRIGTGGAGWTLGHNNPGAQYPFAPLRLGPDTALDNVHLQWAHFGGYAWTDTHVQCFSHTHVVGAGLPDWGNFGVMPLRAAVPSAAQITRHGYRSAHAHADEVMYPGYYSTYLATHDARAELTAAGLDAGVHRYTFDAPARPVALVLDVCHSVRNGEVACPEASVAYTLSASGDVEVDAQIRNAGSLTDRNGRGVWVYLHARIRASNGPLRGAGLWADRTVLPGATSRLGETSQSLGAYFYFGNATAPVVVTVEAGISFVSPALARANLDAQLRGRAFGAVLADTEAMWSDLLGGVAQVTAPRQTDLVKFYTALYRTFMSPTDYVESDGSYLGKDEVVHKIAPGRRYYSDLSLWDTYRTQNPWLNLVRPDVGVDVVNSLVIMFEQGKGLSRWPIANVFTGCMFGDNADMLFIDAWRKGLRDFNLTAAYQAMYTNAMAPQPRDGRGNIEVYIDRGYIPIENSRTGTPNTLAYAYNDWAVAEVAGILGLTADEGRFRARAGNWRNVFSTEALFMCARYADGTFTCPQPPYIPYDDNFVEGNTWHYTWDVPHDLDAFVDAWPSPEAFVDKLDFSMNSSTTRRLIFEENWLPNPFYWAGNEHDLLFPWEFSKAGRADLTQYWTRWMLEHRYTEKPDGLPGNDDYGTMSAWYTFAAGMGLYPVTGADWYFVGSPVVTKGTFKIADGATLTVSAPNNSPTNVYVESVSLNGVPLAEPYVTHAQIASGDAVLEFVMSSGPNTPFNLAYARAWRASYEARRRV